MIDYKGGKVVWDNSYNWERANYDYEQDLLQVKYGNCIIDVGAYSNDGSFTIMVIEFTDKDEKRTFDNPIDYAENPWNHPYAVIPCTDKADMLVQLQRAIDTYPNMINKGMGK